MWPGAPATSWMGSPALVAREKPDLKREDAARQLEHVSRELAEVRAPRPPCFDFESHQLLARLSRKGERRGCCAQGVVRDETLKAVGRHVRLFSPARDALLRSALGHHLMEAQAERLGIALSERDGGPAEQESLHGQVASPCGRPHRGRAGAVDPGGGGATAAGELLRRGEWDSTLAAVREKERRLGESRGAGLLPHAAVRGRVGGYPAGVVCSEGRTGARLAREGLRRAPRTCRGRVV